MRGFGHNGTTAGIQRIAIFDREATGSATPNILIIPTVRKGPAKFTVKDSPLKDHRERNLNSFMMFGFEVEAMDGGDNMLAKALQLVQYDQGAQVEILPEYYLPKHLYPTALDGVYQFMGEQYMGLDLEYTMTQNERALKMIGEVNLPFASAQALLQAATTNQYLYFAANEAGALPISSFDANNYRRQNLTSLTLGEEVMTDYLKDFKLTVKTKSIKNMYSRSSVNYLDVTVEATLMAAGRDALRDYAEILLSTSLNIESTHATGVVEAHNFEAGTLGLIRDYSIGDDERFAKLSFGGSIPIMKAASTWSSAGQTINYNL